MAKGIIGLDIGSHSVKIVHLDPQANLEVVDFQEVRLADLDVGGSGEGDSWFDQEFDTLVFYALPAEDAAVDEHTMSVALPEFGANTEIFASDVAPYLSVLDQQQMQDELQRVSQLNLIPPQRSALERLAQFAREASASGFHTFAYELEPSDLAGEGTAWRQGREAERTEPEEEETQIYDEADERKRAWRRAVGILAERGALDAEYIVTSMPDGEAMTIHVEVPFEDPRQVTSVLPHILMDRLPMSPDKVVYDFRVFPGEEENHDALVGFVRKTDIEDFLNTMDELGADPAIVGIPELFLKGPAVEAGLTGQGTVAIVDIGHSDTHLVILRGDRPVVSRSFRGGGEEITRTIASTFDVDLERAEALKREHATLISPQSAPNEEMRQMSEAVAKALSPIVRDLRRSFQSFTARERVGVDAVHVCGGTSLISNIDEYLASELGVSVRRLESPRLNRLPVDQRARAAEGFGAALAWGSEMLKDQTINLRQGPYVYRGRSSYVRKQALRLGLAVAGVLVALLVALFMQLQAQEAQRDAMRAALAEQTKELFGEPVTSGTELQTRLEGEAPGERGFVPNMSAYRLMYELVDKISSDASLELDRLEVDIDRNLVQIMGETTDAQAVDSLVTDLERLDCLKEIRKDELRVKSEKKAEFELQISSGCS